MKKTLLGISLIVLGLVGFSQAAVLDDAVSWMYTNGLTIYNKTSDYRPNNYIRRDEAAKLFVKFSKLLGKDSYVKTANECIFSDINDSHKDLKDIVIESCRLGIFQGSAGKFMPRNSITNEQAVAVLVRILVGPQSESGVSYRAQNYYKVANEKGLLSQVNMSDRKLVATRGNSAILLATNSDNFIVSNGSKIYQGDAFSFKYPSDGEKVETRTSNTRIMNYIPDEMSYGIKNGGFFINVSTTNQYKNCFDYMALNASGQPKQEEGYSILKSTTKQNGATIYDSIPYQGGDGVAQGELCIERLNKPLYLIAYGANGVDIENIIKDSLTIL